MHDYNNMDPDIAIHTIQWLLVVYNYSPMDKAVEYRDWTDVTVAGRFSYL